MRGFGELLVMIMNTTMIEKLLQKDIDDVAASQKFYVELRTETGSFKVDVSPGKPILEAVGSVLNLRKGGFTVSYGGNNIPRGSFTDQGMNPGARLNISVSPVCGKDIVVAVAADIVDLNPHLYPSKNVEQLMKKARFDRDGALKSWDLSSNRISTLPESFGNLQVVGYLSLNRNRISTLPESFGNLQVVGTLNLSSNKIGTLPESFSNLQVGGLMSESMRQYYNEMGGGSSLDLSNNQIVTLPASFGNLQVGGHMTLDNNQIASLPESFGNLQVGGTLEISIIGNPVAASHPTVPGLDITYVAQPTIYRSS